MQPKKKLNVDRHMGILVVDDFESMRSLIKNVLVKIGFYKIHEAGDGVEALEKIREEDIKLVISDWNMPNMKGIDLLKSVRESPEFKDMPFLMVTAEGFKENVIEAVKAGVSGYIVKPFSPAALQDKIEKIFAKS